MAATPKAHKCPYCKEVLKPEAIVCRHCDSIVASAMEPHGGTCPWCKESIDRDALKCRYCKRAVSSTPVPVGTTEEGGCGCGGEKEGGGSPAGTIARPASGCGPCEVSDFLLGGGHFLMGYRTCWILVPIRISPSGVVTYRRVEWAERCRAYDLETSTHL